MRKLGVCVHGAGWVAGEHVRAYLQNPHTKVVAISSLKDEESHVNLEDAVKTHEICIAADLSAEEGRRVTLPLIKD